MGFLRILPLINQNESQGAIRFACNMRVYVQISFAAF